MSHVSPHGADEVLEAYFRAKDGNRPRVAERVFDAAATLEIRNRSDAIAFPAVTRGAAAIADVLVRQFGRSYDDVHSFCLARPERDATAFSCDWLVGMTARDDGSVRVGAGRYDWTLASSPAWRATRLVITIEAMRVLPASDAPSVYAWLERLAYPWSTTRAVVELAPRLDGLAPVLGYVRREPSALRAATTTNSPGTR